MAIDKQQFQLSLTLLKCRPPKPTTSGIQATERPLPARVTGIDQVLNTHDIEQITGRHRCTIYRWVRAGTFPEKHAGGGRGWLRSDAERWLKGERSSEAPRKSAPGLKLPSVPRRGIRRS